MVTRRLLIGLVILTVLVIGCTPGVEEVAPTQTPWVVTPTPLAEEAFDYETVNEAIFREMLHAPVNGECDAVATYSLGERDRSFSIFQDWIFKDSTSESCGGARTYVFYDYGRALDLYWEVLYADELKQELTWGRNETEYGRFAANESCNEEEYCRAEGVVLVNENRLRDDLNMVVVIVAYNSGYDSELGGTGYTNAKVDILNYLHSFVYGVSESLNLLNE